MEAATLAVPTVGFRSAGGLAESIVDGETGVLCDDGDGFVTAVRTLLVDEDLRRRLGDTALVHSVGFSWDAAALRFAAVLEQVCARPDVLVHEDASLPPD